MEYKEQDNMGYRTISNARDEVEPERIGYTTAIGILENKYQTYGWEILFTLVSDCPSAGIDEVLASMYMTEDEIRIVKPYLIELLSAKLR